MVAVTAVWFLLGVEHTIDLFCDEDIVVLLDEAVEFRSDLFARTAVGLTGCIRKGKEKTKKLLQYLRFSENVFSWAALLILPCRVCVCSSGWYRHPSQNVVM